MTIYIINLPQRSFKHALESRGAAIATSRTTYASTIRHFSIVKLGTHSSPITLERRTAEPHLL